MYTNVSPSSLIIWCNKCMNLASTEASLGVYRVSFKQYMCICDIVGDSDFIHTVWMREDRDPSDLLPPCIVRVLPCFFVSQSIVPMVFTFQIHSVHNTRQSSIQV